MQTVLIETYWNVKQGPKGEKGEQGVVLIETYWNVKYYANEFICVNRTSINRNILECKEMFNLAPHHLRRSINRNILECKVSITNETAVRSVVLIETYWNVKYDIGDLWVQGESINRNILECKERHLVLL